MGKTKPYRGLDLRIGVIIILGVFLTFLILVGIAGRQACGLGVAIPVSLLWTAIWLWLRRRMLWYIRTGSWHWR